MSSNRRVGLLGAILGLSALAGCDQPPASQPAAPANETAAPAAPAASAPSAAEIEAAAQSAAAFQSIRDNLPLATGAWYFADGISAETATDAAKVKGQRVVLLHATPTDGQHHFGLTYEGKAPTGVQITMWVRTTQGVDLFVQASGVTLLEPGRAKDYGVAFVNIAGAKLVENPLVTDETRLKDIAVAADGEWKRVTFTFRSGDPQLYVYLGMVSGGTHVFKGAPEQQLIIGGIQVAPAK